MAGDVTVGKPGVQADPSSLPPDALRARAEVVRVLRAHPNATRGLGLPPYASDHELLEALSAHPLPFNALRNAGCNLATAKCTVEQLTIAKQGNQGEDRYAELWRLLRRNKYLCSCAGGLVFVAFVFCTVAVWIVVDSKAGWLEGQCRLSLFSNSTCMQRIGCAFEVLVQSGGTIYLMTQWQAPVEMSYHLNRVIYIGEPFRCCSQQEQLDCCLFYDERAMEFCDNWPNRVDQAGLPCPSGEWECLFKQNAERTEVSDLRVYEAPVVWPYIAVSATAALFALCLAIYGHLRVAKRCCWGCRRLTTVFYSSEQSLDENIYEDEVQTFHAAPEMLPPPEPPPEAPITLEEATEEAAPSPPVVQRAPPPPSASPRRVSGVSKPEAQSAVQRRSKNATAVKDAWKTVDLTTFAAQPTSHLFQPIVEPLPRRRAPPAREEAVDVDLPCGSLQDLQARADRSATSPTHTSLSTGRRGDATGRSTTPTHRSHQSRASNAVPSSRMTPTHAIQRSTWDRGALLATAPVQSGLLHARPGGLGAPVADPGSCSH